MAGVCSRVADPSRYPLDLVLSLGSPRHVPVYCTVRTQLSHDGGQGLRRRGGVPRMWPGGVCSLIVTRLGCGAHYQVRTMSKMAQRSSQCVPGYMAQYVPPVPTRWDHQGRSSRDVLMRGDPPHRLDTQYHSASGDTGLHYFLSTLVLHRFIFCRTPSGLCNLERDGRMDPYVSRLLRQDTHTHMLR